MKARPNSTYVLDPRENGCGYHPDCFSCPYEECKFSHDDKVATGKTYKRDYYWQNRDKINQRNKEYYHKNKERINARRRAEKKVI